MSDSFILDFGGCRAELLRRLREPAPSRIQLLTGPRQVGKTRLLLELERELGPGALYSSADGPEAALPGYWERMWNQAEELAQRHGTSWLLLDELPHASDWAERLKGDWDRVLRHRLAIHVVGTGSSALRVGAGSRESLAGRFERLTLSHWNARALASTFALPANVATQMLVEWGSYPGAVTLIPEPARWRAYVHDAIVEPALTRDLLALAEVRKPALLRQLFALCSASPAHIVALQKLQGQLQDRGALDTLAHYLQLLRDAYLVAGLEKFSRQVARRRAAPPKLVVLNNALIHEQASWGSRVENACLAHAWNAGQHVSYWREEPREVDAVLEGSWGQLALEVTCGEVRARGVEGLTEFTRRHPDFRPLVVCQRDQLSAARRLGLAAQEWSEFLWDRPP